MWELCRDSRWDEQISRETGSERNGSKARQGCVSENS